MTYLVAWFTIGFISALLGNTYNTREVYEFRLQKVLTRKGMKREDIPNAATYELYKVLYIINGTVMGLFSILGFYDVRRDYKKVQRLAQRYNNE